MISANKKITISDMYQRAGTPVDRHSGKASQQGDMNIEEEPCKNQEMSTPGTERSWVCLRDREISAGGVW